MNFIAELPISNDALGLIIAGLIFLVTVTLIAKKLINFLITLVLLFFAIASGLAISHNDLVREYFKKEKVSHHANDDEYFLEPLRTEAVQLLHRLMELLRAQPSKEANSQLPAGETSVEPAAQGAQSTQPSTRVNPVLPPVELKK